MGGSIRWFVNNPIAANLVMVFLIVGGAMAIPALDKQFFPDFELNMVQVSMPYRGAGPREVEEQICVRIEEAVHDLRGVKEVRSSSRQGIGTVTIEAEADYDMQRLTAEIKTRVDAITTFPVDAERPIITELAHRHQMAVVTLAGDIGERALKELGERLRDDLASQPHVSLVEITSPRPYEVAVEISEYTLRRYGLTFEDVVHAIRGSSLNLPAGAIKTDDGDIQLQTRGQAYERRDFEAIPLLSTREGTQIVLGDVATIVDGFEDQNVRTRFNDMPSHNLNINVTSNPDALGTSESVHAWVEATSEHLPPGVELVVWQDEATPFNGMASILVKNGVGGLVLVFLVLMLFLRPKLALWVCVGIGVAFMGTFMFLQFTDVSLNMLSLFAFLLILGIVVDDAIIVGESVHSRLSSGQHGPSGAVAGTRLVVRPVMYAVVSTMIFFAVMFFLPGDMAHSAVSIPVVVILALSFSLVECMWILPSHLAHMGPPRSSRFKVLRQFEDMRQKLANGMTRFAQGVYRPFLQRCLRSNLLVISIFVVALFLSLALYGGGWIRSAFFPIINSDFVIARVSLQEGGPYSRTMEVLQQIESAAVQVKSDYNADLPPGSAPVVGHIDSRGRENSIVVVIETLSDHLDTREMAERWRELIGDLGPLEDFSLDYTINDRGKPIKLVFTAPSFESLESVAAEARGLLAAYDGIYNVNDSLQAPREEIVLGLKPAAENLSVTLAGLAQQVREAFYGAEAQRIPRTREDVRVMVRYPEEERISVDHLNELRIRTPAGDEVPFDTVAQVSFQPGYLTIDRLNRKRTVEVTAEVAQGTSQPRAVVSDIVTNHLPRWQARYPGLGMRLDGELQEESEFMASLMTNSILAMLIIYALMAIPFRSYWQPLLVLTAVPFGIMGAIFGHLLMNWTISMFSLMGVIACAGVVANDNLVLIDRINQLRSGEHDVVDALLQAGEDRFRPIILTSITTFVGLLPIMSETSMQAQFLIPMVTSLSFGVLFATGVTLLLVPCLYLLGEQLATQVLRRREPAQDAIEGV